MPTEYSKEIQVSKHKENNLFLSSFQCLLCSWWVEQEITGLWNQRRFRLVTREEPCNRNDCGALALQMCTAIRHVSVLVLAGIELIFFMVASVGLCSGFVLKTVLVTQGCFCYC